MRSLPAHSMTHFNVKVAGKAAVLGISRDKVALRSANGIRDFPLRSLVRWASRAMGIALDFGAKKFLLQTDQGEAISQLLAGYFDLLLKGLNLKKKGRNIFR